MSIMKTFKFFRIGIQYDNVSNCRDNSYHFCYFFLFAVLLLSVVTWQAMAAPTIEPLEAVSGSVNTFATNFFKVKINSLHYFSVVSVPVVPISSSSSSCSFCSSSSSCFCCSYFFIVFFVFFLLFFFLFLLFLFLHRLLRVLSAFLLLPVPVFSRLHFLRAVPGLLVLFVAPLRLHLLPGIHVIPLQPELQPMFFHFFPVVRVVLVFPPPPLHRK